jgi:hypothetical protein
MFRVRMGAAAAGVTVALAAAMTALAGGLAQASPGAGTVLRCSVAVEVTLRIRGM